MRGRRALVGLALILMLGVPAADWPQFRGPDGTGTAADAAIPLEWSESKHVAWKVKLPGSGWSQPVVIGNRVFVTAAISDPPLRPKDFTAGVKDPSSIPGLTKRTAPNVTIDWRVLALDLQSGAVLWSTTAVKGKPKYPIHPSNTYATETPAADAQGVYAYFGATGTVAAFDHSGKPLWKRELETHPTLQGLGTGSSPALFDGKLFIQSFHEEKSFLVCLDTKTGDEKWRVTREKAATSWSTPLVWRTPSRTEVVASGGQLMTSHNPETGQELWRVAGMNVPGASSLTADRERIYFGYRSPFATTPLYALKAGATGDQTPAAGEKAIRSEAWSRTGAAPGMPSPLVAGGYVYSLNDSVLTCLDAQTGTAKYKERLPNLRSIAASPVAVGDKVIVLDENGKAVILKAGPTFEVIGRAQLDDTFWASPAVAGGALLFRGIDFLYCIRL